MKPIVLVGHAHHCPIHGAGEVITGSSTTLLNGRPVARVGDEISCGAVIETGSPYHSDQGRPIARVGDSTDHGGTLIEGDGDWVLD
ncbi:PAAR domain-containing protein [Pseudomonas sp. HR96]|uniref:PAAR domain-containing protein n=1 Tax=Pseudomonas sp. HR96 TaxID=1027966 RepID=UPI002A75704C|nr:PAAR domain-containing protein [Pseudomonas sp. HR96]WPO98797.1 PAAR domain-containing protein [Pseudomonas sp. HR96]